MENKEFENSKTEAYVNLITLHQARIYSYILSMVPHFSDADDLMQKTCKVIWEKFDDYQQGTDFLSWAIKIANFKIYEYWRAEKKRSSIHFNEALIHEIESDARHYAEDSNRYLPYLYECIKKLNKEDLKLIRLKYYRNLKAKEISARFGKSVFTIYKNLSRIYQALQACVRRSEIREEKS